MIKIIYSLCLGCLTLSVGVSGSFRGSLRGSDERHAKVGAFFPHVVWPDAGLDLTDMGFVEQDETEAALTDTSSDGEREFSAEQLLVEEEVLALHLSGELKLAHETLLIHTDAHG